MPKPNQKLGLGGKSIFFDEFNFVINDNLLFMKIDFLVFAVKLLQLKVAV